MANWRAWSAQNKRQDETLKRKQDIAKSLMDSVRNNPSWGEAEIRNAARMLSGGGLPEYGHLVSGDMLENFAEANRKEFDRNEKIRLDALEYDRHQDFISNMPNLHAMEDRAFNSAISGYSDEDILSADIQEAWNRYNSTFDPRHTKAGASKLTIDQFTDKFKGAQDAARKRIQDERERQQDRADRRNSDLATRARNRRTDLGTARSDFVNQFSPSDLQGKLDRQELWPEYQEYLASLGIDAPSGPEALRTAARSRLTTARANWQEKAARAKEEALTRGNGIEGFYSQDINKILNQLHIWERAARGQGFSDSDAPLITGEEVAAYIDAAGRKQQQEKNARLNALKPEINSWLNQQFNSIPYSDIDSVKRDIYDRVYANYGPEDQDLITRILREYDPRISTASYWGNWLDEKRPTLVEEAKKFSDKEDFTRSFGNAYRYADPDTRAAIDSIWTETESGRNAAFQVEIEGSIQDYVKNRGRNPVYLANLYSKKDTNSSAASAWNDATSQIVDAMQAKYPNRNITADDVARYVAPLAEGAFRDKLTAQVDSLKTTIKSKLESATDANIETPKTIEALKDDAFGQQVLALLGVPKEMHSRAAALYLQLKEDVDGWEYMTAHDKALQMMAADSSLVPTDMRGSSDLDALAEAQDTLNYLEDPTSFTEAVLEDFTEFNSGFNQEITDLISLDLKSTSTAELNKELTAFDNYIKMWTGRAQDIGAKLSELKPFMNASFISSASASYRSLVDAVNRANARYSGIRSELLSRANEVKAAEEAAEQTQNNRLDSILGQSPNSRYQMARGIEHEARLAAARNDFEGSGVLASAARKVENSEELTEEELAAVERFISDPVNARRYGDRVAQLTAEIEMLESRDTSSMRPAARRNLERKIEELREQLEEATANTGAN